MEKWSVELGRFHIDYEPKTAIKCQVLADFIAEFTDDTTPTTEETSVETVASAGTPYASTGGKEIA